MSEHGTENEQKNYEITDANAKGVVIAGVVLAVIAAASFLASYILLKYSTERAASTDYEPSPLVTEYTDWNQDVRLQEDPDTDLAQHLANTEPLVERHGVVSENPPIYHFPVSDAIDYVVDHGLPEFKPFGDGSLDGTGD